MKVDSCNSGMNFRGKNLFFIKRGEPSQAIKLAENLYTHNAKRTTPSTFGINDAGTNIAFNSFREKLKGLPITVWVENLGGGHISAFQKTSDGKPTAILLNASIKDAQKALEGAEIKGQKVVVPAEFSAENRTFLPFPTSKY